MNTLEYRMYFFTLYNISEIQKGIQCGHAALEYAYKYHENNDYKSFIENDKTWIILNGGTTNSCDENLGSLNVILKSLEDNGIKHAAFYEPDLNDALTAICFIADERVYDYKKYQDFIMPDLEDIESDLEFTNMSYTDIENTLHKEWINDIIGSSKNLFLRNLIRYKKLA